MAVIENDALMAETLTFDAPPIAPISAPKSPKRKSLSASPKSDTSSEKRRWWGTVKKAKKEKKQKDDQVDLPFATEAALGLLGFGFKTAVFVLEIGVKVTAAAVMGATHVARKL